MPTVFSTLANSTPGDPDIKWGTITRLAPLVPYLVLLSLIVRLSDSSSVSDVVAASSYAIYHQASRRSDEMFEADIRRYSSENARLVAQVAIDRSINKGLLHALEGVRVNLRKSRLRTARAIGRIASLKGVNKCISRKQPHLLAQYAEKDAEIHRHREEAAALRSDLEMSQARAADLQARLDERDSLLREALEDRLQFRLQLEKELAGTKESLRRALRRCEDQENLISDLSSQLEEKDVRDEAYISQYISANDKLSAEVEAMKLELMMTTSQRDDFKATLDGMLEVTATASDMDEPTAMPHLTAQIAQKANATADFEEVVMSLSRSIFPPVLSIPQIYRLPTPEPPELVYDGDSSSSSDSDSPPSTPVLATEPLADLVYSLPSPPPVSFSDDDDDDELPITPFPRKLGSIRGTVCSTRPTLRGEVLMHQTIRRAMGMCKRMLPSLPGDALDAVTYVNGVASERILSNPPRFHQLRDEPEHAEVEYWVPGPVKGARLIQSPPPDDEPHDLLLLPNSPNYSSSNANFEAEVEAMKIELATATWEHNDFTATLDDLKDGLKAFSGSTTPPTSPGIQAHQLQASEMLDVADAGAEDHTTTVVGPVPFTGPVYMLPSPPPIYYAGEDNDGLPVTPCPQRLVLLHAGDDFSSDPDPGPATFVMEPPPLAEASYSLPSPPRVYFDHEDDDGLPITPFPRRLARLLVDEDDSTCDSDSLSASSAPDFVPFAEVACNFPSQEPVHLYDEDEDDLSIAPFLRRAAQLLADNGYPTSEFDSPLAAPILDTFSFDEPAYSLPTPSPVYFDSKDCKELSITPFPRRLRAM